MMAYYDSSKTYLSQAYKGQPIWSNWGSNMLEGYARAVNDSSTVFNNNPSNQRFYVRRSDLSWFESATNWSAIYGEGKIVAAADYIEYLQSIGVDTSDFEGE